MPRKALAWAAWNYHLTAELSERATVTYNMNILQSLAASKTLLLSLNRGDSIDPSSVIDRFIYHHPTFTPAAIAAQNRVGEISGQRRTFYLGAYWGYGFHEDGVNSALAALSEFGRQQHAQPHLQRVG
jgi:predicted NAD/FAD-binding protein